MTRRYVRKGAPLAERLAHYMGAVDARGCQEWFGARATNGGYGILKWEGRMHPVTRLVWQAQRGPIPAGMVVCHRCDNPPCCALDHLFIGTKADNNRDRKEKGRSAPKHGRHNGRAILSEAEVIRIRADSRSLQKTADAYEVSKSTIADIRSGRRWRHVGAENGVTFREHAPSKAAGR